MKKILTVLLILTLLTAVAPVAQATESSTGHTVIAMHPIDLRAEALKNVFAKYNSPLVPFVNSFVDTADKYDMDWELLPAISGIESTFGKHEPQGSYNSYGWGGGRLYFKSVDDGIEVVLSNLKTKYASRGATTVETIAPIYSESPTWAPRVRHFMNEIDAEYVRLGMHKLDLTI